MTFADRLERLLSTIRSELRLLRAAYETQLQRNQELEAQLRRCRCQASKDADGW